MENSSGIMPVMPMGNTDFGGGSGMWLFALILLALIGGNGFGGWGNNGFANAIGYENLATSNEVQRGFDNQNLQAQTRDILSAVTNGTAQTIASSTANATNAINAIKDGNASLIREFGNVETALTALDGNMRNCCCDVKQLIQATSSATDAQIAQNRYEAAMNTASINATTTAQTQKILDALAQDKIEALQNQINALQLQNAVAGVVRYPMSTTYSSGGNPFCSCGCGCNNI